MSIRVGDRSIGPGERVFVIAEIGLNHNGDVALAERLVRTAAAAGVDAVKFQKRDTKALLAKELYDAPYDAWYSYGATYGEHRDALELSADDLSKLKMISEELGVVFFLSAWDLPSVEVSEEIGIPLYKVASADVTNHQLLDRIARTGKPIIMSTGMSSEAEISAAVDLIRSYHDQLVLLHCISTYPAEFDELNLRTIPWLQQRFGLPVGYSGHERGIAISATAVGLGACVIERHFTLDRSMKGPDHAASLEPPGLMKLVRDIRAVEHALGGIRRAPLERELATREKLSKSLVAARSLEVGDVVSEADLVAKSPGKGIEPYRISELLGRTVVRHVEADTRIAFDDFSES